MSVLTALFNPASFDISRCAHVAIDVQKKFLSASYEADLRDIASHITTNIAPAFNALGIPTYWIWMGQRQRRTPDFYGAQPANTDFIVKKSTVSAFDSGRFSRLLKDNNHDILIVSGFYTGACVDDTLRDARRQGYRAVLMTDATGRWLFPDKPEFDLEACHRAGVIMAPSAQVLTALKSLNNPT